jgi:hypothetical protein
MLTIRYTRDPSLRLKNGSGRDDAFRRGRIGQQAITFRFAVRIEALR